MRRLVSFVSGAARSVARAYHLVCAREDVRNHGLRTPLGVWFCERCRVVMFDGWGWRYHAACGVC